MAEYLVQSESITAVADAIREKGGTTAPLSFPAGMVAAVRDIQGEGGLTYVVGTPVSFTLTGWDSDVQGTTYTLKAVGYKIGAGGVQLGLPSDSSTVNTQAVVAAALTLANATVTAPDTEKNIAGYTTLEIVAVTPPDREITIALFGLEKAEPVTITKSAIEGIAVPVAGNTPASTVECEQFTGTVSWSPDKVDGRFGPVTAYTATITLTPKQGYKLDGVAANFFTVEGASSVSNSANSGVVTAVFPATGTVTVWERRISGIPKPNTGNTPVSTITEDTNFTGTVSWSPAASTFAASTVYTATITLTAKAGFTFEGVEENSFSVSGLPSSVTNAANSNVVTAVFPAT